MQEFIKGLGFTYLIWPIMGILFVFLGVFIAKKNNLLSNKRLIGSFIVSVLIFALPGFLGYMGYTFMPYGYVIAVSLYLILGWYNIKLIKWIFKDGVSFAKSIIFIIFQIIVGMLLFILIFNLTNDLKYGFYAATSMLSILQIFFLVKSYELFLLIPEPIYEIWNYSDNADDYFDENIDYERLKVVTLEIYKKEGDVEPLRLKVKVPNTIVFGTWMSMLLEDYNKKTSLEPIDYGNYNNYVNWIFYKHNSWILPKQYIDHTKTIEENNIKENCFIIAKRVKEYIEE